ETIVALSQTLGLASVAQGVETQEQLEFLRQLGPGFAQGFLFSTPRSPTEIEEMLRRHPVRCSSALRVQPVHGAVAAEHLQLAIRIAPERQHVPQTTDRPLLMVRRSAVHETEAAQETRTEIRVEVGALEADECITAVDE